MLCLRIRTGVDELKDDYPEILKWSTAQWGVAVYEYYNDYEPDTAISWLLLATNNTQYVVLGFTSEPGYRRVGLMTQLWRYALQAFASFMPSGASLTITPANSAQEDFLGKMGLLRDTDSNNFYRLIN